MKFHALEICSNIMPFVFWLHRKYRTKFERLLGTVTELNPNKKQSFRNKNEQK